MFQTFRYRNVEPHCRSLHFLRPWKLPYLSERATQPHAVYLLTPNQTYEDNIGCPRTKGWYLYDTPKGRNVALFLTTLEIFRISDSQNQSAETPYTKMFIPTFAFAAWGNLYLFIVFPCRETICFANLLKIIHI